MKKIISLILINLSVFASQEVQDFWNQYDPHKAPLNTEIIKEWQEGENTYMLLRYDLGLLKGTNKSASPKIAAYYGFPTRLKGKSPGIVHIHGGGQKASLSRVKSWTELGYAAISINWGAKVIDKPNTPNTDWDGIAAGFIRPGITIADDLDHHNTISPDNNTLYKEFHLLNSSWNLIAMSVRRALTFLESRQEVDPHKLGIEGHSMGGNPLY
ncbi:hypothetical protein PQO03_17390 [Lentisphaera profundi]|uniref:Acetyl xylan esterase domain-containing protein n=1 Tax=Lentisphaera profundi TaxID=1658616 RepID=A0ABY7VWG2_9BACT|nr:hypothetical protein [Lentisphaera profundi]WDE97604.1 hypothetical protein PQO03_17390 [Lentisphaera profundi]